MYVAVKGGENAIDHAHRWLDEQRRGDPATPELDVAQIEQQMHIAVSRVMAEGSLYDPELAALALKQAQGDVIEAVFLMRAYRTTLPRLGSSLPLATERMVCKRRISAIFKDLPGGQILGPTFDYTHRLLEFKLLADGEAEVAQHAPASARDLPHVLDFLNREGLIQEECDSGASPADLTRQPLAFPATRSTRLQALARGDEGFLLSMGYSTQRGYSRNHPFVGELRVGWVDVRMEIPELGFAIEIASIEITECNNVNQFTGNQNTPAQFTRGYGLVLGHQERKAISMALVDRAMQWQALGEDFEGSPAQDEEFILSHCDNVQATGFVEHIKLPHYVDFQSELELVRKLRRQASDQGNHS